MSPQRVNLPAILHTVDQTFNKKLFQQEILSKKIWLFVSGMVRAGEKIKYRSVGHSVCQI